MKKKVIYLIESCNKLSMWCGQKLKTCFEFFVKIPSDFSDLSVTFTETKLLPGLQILVSLFVVSIV